MNIQHNIRYNNIVYIIIPYRYSYIIDVTCIAKICIYRRERLVSFFYKFYIEIIKLNNKYINVLDDIVLWSYTIIIIYT